MGWIYSNRTRHQLIHDLIAPGETEAARYETIAHTLCGNVLWTVVRITAKQPGVLKLGVGQSTSIIGCTLLEHSDGQWGYKPMDESVHPYYYSCPLSYLTMAPEQSSPWREGVRAYHARRRTPMMPVLPAPN